MSRPTQPRRQFPEPTTEDEAREQRDFLETGSAQTTEPVLELPAPVDGLVVTAEEPGVVQLDAPSPDVRSTLGDDVQTNAVVALTFSEVDGADSFFLRLFVDDEAAGPDTPDDAPTAGSIAFFCMTDDPAGASHCVSADGSPIQYQVDVSDALRRSESSGQLLLTVVLTPLPARQPPSGRVVIQSAALTVLRTESG